jgi:hypothetical protein
MGSGLYDAWVATLGRLYGKDVRRAITLTLCGGFASTVCWPVSAWLVERFGWRGACTGRERTAAAASPVRGDAGRRIYAGPTRPVRVQHVEVHRLCRHRVQEGAVCRGEAAPEEVASVEGLPHPTAPAGRLYRSCKALQRREFRDGAQECRSTELAGNPWPRRKRHPGSRCDRREREWPHSRTWQESVEKCLLPSGASQRPRKAVSIPSVTSRWNR